MHSPEDSDPGGLEAMGIPCHPDVRFGLSLSPVSRLWSACLHCSSAKMGVGLLEDFKRLCLNMK